MTAFQKKKKFYFAKQITTNTHITRNHGRLPEKGVHPSKLATYCRTHSRTQKIQMCKCVKLYRKKNELWTQNTEYNKINEQLFIG